MQLSEDVMVSIVIPVYNGRRFIRSALESALGQTYGNVEVVVVDDGSDDGTETILERQYKGGITLVTHEGNKGLAFARNSGIRHAGGMFVLFLDSDDILAPDAVEQMVQAAKKADDPDNTVFVSCSWSIRENDGYPVPIIPRKTTADKIKSVVSEGFAPGCFFTARDIFEKYGYFREDIAIAEDLEMISRLYLLCNVDVCIIKRMLWIRRIHDDSFTHRESDEEIHSKRQITYRIIADGLDPESAKAFLSACRMERQKRVDRLETERVREAGNANRIRSKMRRTVMGSMLLRRLYMYMSGLLNSRILEERLRRSGVDSGRFTARYVAESKFF